MDSGEDAARIIAAWNWQLDKLLFDFVRMARENSSGAQVVLNVYPDGKLGKPKITVTADSKP
jgi:hypothetical protein